MKTHKCYFCDNEVKYENKWYGRCPNCETSFSEDIVKKVDSGWKKNPSKELINFIRLSFINENNEETVHRLVKEHMQSVSWNWTKWDYGLVFFAWYLDSMGFEFSTIYRKGKFIVSSKNHIGSVKMFMDMFPDFNYIKSISFTKNKINVTLNMKLIENNLTWRG